MRFVILLGSIAIASAILKGLTGSDELVSKELTSFVAWIAIGAMFMDIVEWMVNLFK